MTHQTEIIEMLRSLDANDRLAVIRGITHSFIEEETLRIKNLKEEMLKAEEILSSLKQIQI